MANRKVITKNNFQADIFNKDLFHVRTSRWKDVQVDPTKIPSVFRQFFLINNMVKNRKSQEGTKRIME